jgi:hypothetical protein
VTVNPGAIVRVPLIDAHAWNVETVYVSDCAADIARYDNNVGDIVTRFVSLDIVEENPLAVCCGEPADHHAYMSGNSTILTWNCQECGFYAEQMV